MGTNTTKDARAEHPSSWLTLTKNQSVSYIIDALLDLRIKREFNKSELAEMTGVSRNSVGNHIDLFVGLGIVTPVEGTHPQRYRFDATSDVSKALIKLERAVNNQVSNQQQEPAAPQ